jgi:hypothetical protein
MSLGRAAYMNTNEFMTEVINRKTGKISNNIRLSTDEYIEIIKEDKIASIIAAPPDMGTHKFGIIGVNFYAGNTDCFIGWFGCEYCGCRLNPISRHLQIICQKCGASVD